MDSTKTAVAALIVSICSLMLTLVRVLYDLLGDRKRLTVIPEIGTGGTGMLELRVTVINDGKAAVSLRSVSVCKRIWPFRAKDTSDLYCAGELAPVIHPGGNWSFVADSTDLGAWYLSSHVRVTLYRNRAFYERLPQDWKFGAVWSKRVCDLLVSRISEYEVNAVRAHIVSIEDQFGVTWISPLWAIAAPGQNLIGFCRMKSTELPTDWHFKIAAACKSAAPRLFSTHQTRSLFWSDEAKAAVKTKQLPPDLFE